MCVIQTARLLDNFQPYVTLRQPHSVFIENGNKKQICAAESVQRTQGSHCLLSELSVDLKPRTPAVETSAQTAELLAHSPPV